MKIELPQGSPLLDDTAIELKPHEDVLINGPSGAGKSTFFRSLAGIWPYWKGRIRLPRGARLLFLPQKPYLPLGSLKHAVAYPDDPAKHPDDEVRSALQAVGLGQLAPDPGAANWAQVLGRRAAPRIRPRAVLKPTSHPRRGDLVATGSGPAFALWAARRAVGEYHAVSIGHREIRPASRQAAGLA